MQPQPTPQTNSPQGDHIDIKIGDNNQNVIAGKNITVVQQPAPFEPPRVRPKRPEHFQDRKKELAQLLLDLQPSKVVALCGPAGMGKSALAAQAIWSLDDNNQLFERFPDGILWHNFYNDRLNEHALDRLLEKIAQTFARDLHALKDLKLPPQEAAQRALSGRRALLLLESVESVKSLRPLLGICNDCCVLITSRARRYAEASRQDLTPLPPDDAVTLLQAWAGQQIANREMAQQISHLVGYWPFALHLVGKYLSCTGEGAEQYLDWLKKNPFNALDQEEMELESVPLLLKHSLEQVSERARQMLGIVGLLAAAPFGWAMVAEALLFSEEIAGRETQQALGELVNYGLLISKEKTYEVSHALIHTYARQQLAPPDKVIVAFGNYYWQEIDAHKNDFTHLHSLREHILAFLYIASERESWDIVYNLVSSIDDYLDMQGFWVDRVNAITLSLNAAYATHNHRNQSVSLGNLGVAYRHSGRVDIAIHYFLQALDIAKEIGDRQCEEIHLVNLGKSYVDEDRLGRAIDYFHKAKTIAEKFNNRKNAENHLCNLGNIYYSLGNMEQAIICYQKALAITREIGDRRSEGTALGYLGRVYINWHHTDWGIAFCQQALAIAREIGDRRGEGNHIGNLGIAYCNLGQMDQAIFHYQQALSIAREIGDLKGVGADLSNLGYAYQKLGQSDLAKQFWQEALQIFEEIHSPKAFAVRQQLESLEK